MKINFKARKKARTLVLQALYGWMLTDNSVADIELEYLTKNGNKNFERDYFIELLHNIPKNLTEIDNLYSGLSSIDKEQLDPIECTVLRIAAYEFKYRIDIPYKVVINEALELNKTFGSVEGYKFINGVLDKLATELRSTEQQ